MMTSQWCCAGTCHWSWASRAHMLGHAAAEASYSALLHTCARAKVMLVYLPKQHSSLQGTTDILQSDAAQSLSTLGALTSSGCRSWCFHVPASSSDQAPGWPSTPTQAPSSLHTLAVQSPAPHTRN